MALIVPISVSGGPKANFATHTFAAGGAFPDLLIGFATDTKELYLYQGGVDYWFGTGGGSGGGTVTSVGISVPSDLFSISGSPVTTSGMIAIDLQNQTANKVFAGPTSGADAAPTFRTLVAADLPDDFGYCEPLTNGDPDDPQLIFDDDGDVIMVG